MRSGSDAAAASGAGPLIERVRQGATTWATPAADACPRVCRGHETTTRRTPTNTQRVPWQLLCSAWFARHRPWSPWQSVAQPFAWQCPPEKSWDTSCRSLSSQACAWCQQHPSSECARSDRAIRLERMGDIRNPLGACPETGSDSKDQTLRIIAWSRFWSMSLHRMATATAPPVVRAPRRSRRILADSGGCRSIRRRIGSAGGSCAVATRADLRVSCMAVLPPDGGMIQFDPRSPLR